MTSFEKIRKVCGKQDEKVYGLRQFPQRKTRRFAGFVRDMTPAGCGLDFEGILSPQSPAITARNYWICNSVIGRQHGRLYRNPHGE